MDFKSYLKETAKDLDQQVQVILDEWLKEVEKISPKLVPLAQAFVKACQGGKKIRGALVRLGYELGKDHLGGVLANHSATIRGEMGEITRVGAAYEIFHAAILAHDDIIDLSSTRRGLPTLYKALGGPASPDERASRGGDHYGISQTIALGDIGFFLAVKIISESDFEDEFKSKALGHFAKTVINTGLGEVLDVEVPHLGGGRKEEDVISIHTLKTAQYTISGPLVLGAILAGAEQDLLGVLDEFGQELGIAFQIQDDILGVFGDEKELGKSVTSDIEEGKNTLLITEALKKANQDQKEILDRYYGKGNVGDRGLMEVRKIFIDTGALDYSRKEAANYVKIAKKIIPQITKDHTLSTLLEQMAEYLVERTK